MTDLPYLAYRSKMRTVLINTRLGQVAFTELSNTGAPVAALMYGVFRGSDCLQPLIQRLSGVDVVVVHQPGHSGAPELTDIGVVPYAQAVGVGVQTLFQDRDVFLAGESLGGLISLAVGAYALPCLRSVVAFDPFFTTAKLWPIHRQTADMWPISSGPRIMDRIFGIGASSVEQRDYRGVLRTLAVPATVVTGDCPLLPERETDQSPCLMDDDDCEAVEASSASLIRLAGGHRLIEQCPDQCAEVLNQVMRLRM